MANMIMLWLKKRHDSETNSKYLEFSNAEHIVNMDNHNQFNQTLKNIIK